MRDPARPLAAGAAWASARRVLRWVAVGWTLAALAVVVLIVHYASRERAQVARIRAEEACRGEFAFHSWNAEHGGVYELVSPGALPDPRLTDVADRDLTTAAGQKLMLVNPIHLYLCLKEK